MLLNAAFTQHTDLYEIALLKQLHTEIALVKQLHTIQKKQDHQLDLSSREISHEHILMFFKVTGRKSGQQEVSYSNNH